MWMKGEQYTLNFCIVLLKNSVCENLTENLCSIKLFFTRESIEANQLNDRSGNVKENMGTKCTHGHTCLQITNYIFRSLHFFEL